MKEHNQQQLIQQYAIRLGDDALVLGHRLSEWCRCGPFLEEDIALINVALDYIGRARLFYGYAAELSDGKKTEDDFAYLRDCQEYQNFLLHELPRGDFAFTIARQLIVDIYYSYFLPCLQKSTNTTLSAIAAKVFKETQYHLRRSVDWTLCLGDGTEESHQRIQTAFDQLWGYVPEMFKLDSIEKKLLKDGIAVDTSEIENAWLAKIKEVLREATLTIPKEKWVVRGGRAGYHTEHLGHLLSESQYLQRAYPGQAW